MCGAEVGASGADNDTFDDSGTIFLVTSMTCLSVGMMMLLELALLALDVSVVRHGISAEVDTFLQSLFGRFKHEFQIFLRDLFYYRERMHTASPENFVRINIADASDQGLVH